MRAKHCNKCKARTAFLEKGNGHWLIQYIYNIGLCLSQILSTILGGDPDESVSSRTGKGIRANIWWFVHVQGPFIDWLLGEPDHCLNSIEDDEGAKEIWHWIKLRNGFQFDKESGSYKFSSDGTYHISYAGNTYLIEFKNNDFNFIQRNGKYLFDYQAATLKERFIKLGILK